MSHGTTIYFKHDDEAQWLSQLIQIQDILLSFGALWDTLGNGAFKGQAYWVNVGDDPNELSGDVKIESRSGRTTRITCSSLDSLAEGSIKEIAASWRRGVRYPCSSRKKSNARRGGLGLLSISLEYSPRIYVDNDHSDSQGVWRLNMEASLDPDWARINVEEYQLYAYQEIWDYYDLVKRIHREVGFHLTAGSFLENYYRFGESEGDRPGFDSLFRFDRSGPSRVILPFEERRPFHTERDGNGKNELSFDPQTGLYRCVVETGPV